MKKPPPIYYVEWVDSAQTVGWHEELPEGVGPVPCQSVGFLVKRDRDCIILALNRNANEMGDLMSIPRAVIKKMERLR